MRKSYIQMEKIGSSSLINENCPKGQEVEEGLKVTPTMSVNRVCWWRITGGGIQRRSMFDELKQRE